MTQAMVNEIGTKLLNDGLTPLEVQQALFRTKGVKVGQILKFNDRFFAK